MALLGHYSYRKHAWKRSSEALNKIERGISTGEMLRDQHYDVGPFFPSHVISIVTHMSLLKTNAHDSRFELPSYYRTCMSFFCIATSYNKKTCIRVKTEGISEVPILSKSSLPKGLSKMYPRRYNYWCSLLAEVMMSIIVAGVHFHHTMHLIIRLAVTHDTSKHHSEL